MMSGNLYLCEFALSAEDAEKYPFAPGELLIMLGEIAQMPGHCVVAKKDGSVFFGYHTENFRKLKRSEC